MKKDLNVKKFIGDVVDGLESAVNRYSPKTIEQASCVVRIDALESLIQSVIALGFAIGGFYGAQYLYGMMVVCGDYHSDCNIGLWIPCVISGIVCLIAACISFSEFFSVWNWVALFKPQTYLAKQVYDKVFGSSSDA